jgi:thiol-disulfide isomerase/thioredoxin
MQQIHKFKEVKDIINKELVMIVAKSHDCSSCKMINKMLETNVKNLDQIEVYNIYIDDIDQFRGEYLIFSVPTVVIFSEGKELLRESRYINYDKITRLISMFK